MAGAPEARAMMRADNRRLRRDLDTSKKMFSKSFAGIGRNIKGLLSSAMSPLGVGAGIAGLAVVGKEVVDFESTLGRLQIQSGASNEAIGTFREQLMAMSADTGIAREALLGGAEALVNLQGVAGFSIETLGVLADAQLATGASMEDLAGLTFALGNAFDVASPKDLRKGLSGIIEAGKKGAVPLTQMSTLLQQLSADFHNLGSVTGPAAAADLSAALQVTRDGFGSAEQAATGLNSFFNALGKNATKLHKKGVQVFDKDPKTGEKRFRDLRAILDDFENSKLIKDPEALVKALGRDEARKAFAALRANRQEFEALAAAARKSDAVNTDAAKRRQQDAFKIEKAWNDAKLALVEAFTPERITLFSDALGKAAETFGYLVEHAEDFVGAWAGLKLIGVMSNMRSMLTTASAIRTATMRTQVAMAGVATAAGVAGAAMLGWNVGKIIDDALGLSDAFAKIRNASLSVEEKTAGAVFEGGPKTWLGRALAEQGFLGETDADRRRKFGRSQRVLQAAREQGFLSPSGELISQRDLSWQLERRGMGGAAPERAAEIRRSVLAAQSVERGYAKTDVEVMVTVDQRGMLLADETKESKARRSAR